MDASGESNAGTGASRDMGSSQGPGGPQGEGGGIKASGLFGGAGSDVTTADTATAMAVKIPTAVRARRMRIFGSHARQDTPEAVSVAHTSHTGAAQRPQVSVARARGCMRHDGPAVGAVR